MDKLPRILCIGAQKAGTSWLHENLATHPQIWVPPFKELHFFDYKFLEDSKKWAKWHVRSNIRNLIKSRDHTPDKIKWLNSLIEEPFLNGSWYKKIFSAMGERQYGLDVTPEYCTVPTEGIAFIRKFLKDPLIIYIVRDPVDRALSQIRMNMVRSKLDFANLDHWVQASSDPVITARGDYRTYIPRWDASGMKVLYLAFGDIKSSPENLLAEVEEFCGLKPSKYPNAMRRVFETAKVPIPHAIQDKLNTELRAQKEYLTGRFDQNFVNRT